MLSIISFLISSAMAVTVSLMPSEVYVPMGFDTNDTNVQIGFDSMYPDTCYQYLPSKAKVSESEKVIRIDNLSEYKEDQICAKVIRYFDDVVSLGPVKTTGLYDVQFLQSNGQYKSFAKIQIFKPEDDNSVDDSLYAPLSDVQVIEKLEGNKLKLIASSPYSCLKFEDVKLSVSKNTIIVLPTVNEPNCDIDSNSHKITTEVSLVNLKGRYLLHIRAMNGKAINKFIELN